MGLSKYKYQKLKKQIIENKHLEWVIDLTQDIKLHTDGFINGILGTNMTAEESLEFCREHNLYNDIDVMAYAMEHNCNGNLENWIEKFIEEEK